MVPGTLHQVQPKTVSMQVVIFGRTLKEADIPYVQTLFDALHGRGIATYIYAPYLKELESVIFFRNAVHPFEGYPDFSRKKVDFFITLGGDGTILDAVTIVRDSGVPVLGINLGRLGFLASIEKKRIIETLEALEDNRFWLDERSMLHLESDQALFGETNFALNDFTLLKRDTSSMVTIKTFLNGDLLNVYWADGLIVATPTGSTGYSLSCGGPIIFPNSGNFVITPVAPHNLNVRPIVISDDSVVSFQIEGRTEHYLCTLDSRFEAITTTTQIAVRKCDHSICLVRLQNRGFLQTLREKLNWGADLRN